MAKVTDWRKTKRYAELKASMLDDLEARGLLETQRTTGRTVTGDVEKIAQTRRALAQTLVHHFYHQAAALGLTKAEIAALLEQEEA